MKVNEIVRSTLTPSSDAMVRSCSQARCWRPKGVCVIPEFGRGLAEYRMLLFGLAMVLIMVWRPGGLLAHREPTVRLKQQSAPAKEAAR